MRKRMSQRRARGTRTLRHEFLERRELMTIASPGVASVTGDFNRDGYMDVAIGAPQAGVSGVAYQNVGQVEVVYGSPTGLAGGKHLVLNKSDVSTKPAKIGDSFGHALAAADFNKDGYTDLAIGVPQDDSAKTDAGAVYIIFGSRNGLVLKKSAPITQAMVSNDSCEAGDFFGFSLATGDFNKDGHADLAIGAPYEDVLVNGQSRSDAGAVSIAYGSATGLAMKKNALIVQSNVSEDASENGDLFGFSLAVGDFNRDGAADLAIGVPGENLLLSQGKTANDAGAVDVVFGSAAGLVLQKRPSITQPVGRFPNSLGRAAGNQFGYSLAAGDFNGDRYADLAIGVPGEDYPLGLSKIPDSGAVDIVFGSRNGLSKVDLANHHLTQAQLGLRPYGELGSEKGDAFGFSLAVGDFDRDGYADLAIGTPGEDIPNPLNWSDSGAVDVVFGSGGGLGRGFPSLHLVRSEANASDLFGRTMAVGDFNGDGYADLAIWSASYDPVEGYPHVLESDHVDTYYGCLVGLVRDRRDPVALKH